MLGTLLFDNFAEADRRDPLDPHWYTEVARQTSSGVDVNESTAFTYSAVWAATRLLAGSAAWLPLNLNESIDTPEGKGKRLADDRGEYWLLHSRPNPEMTSMAYRMYAFNSQINWGNSYSEMQRDGLGNVVALWPIHPSRVELKRDLNDSIFYEVRNNGTSEPSIISFEDILHIPSIITDDGITGKGVIRHARETIGFGVALERYGANWFGSGGVPRIVVKHPRLLSAEARDNFRKEWREVYSGSDAERVALLMEGADIQPIGLSQEDSQFLETREHNVEEIARWYGVPPHMIQDLRRSTDNNIEQQGQEFVVYSLIQYLAIWEQVLGMKVLPERDQKTFFFKFNVMALLRGDAKTRAEFYASMLNNALMNRNEIRALEDLNPVPGGDTFYIQGAMAAIDDEGNVNPPAATIESPDQQPVDSGDNGEASSQILENIVTASKKIEALHTSQRELREDIESTSTKTSESFNITQERCESIFGAVESLQEKVVMSEAKTIKVLKEVLTSSIQRIVGIEVTALNRFANKPENFVDSVDKFYDKHAGVLSEAMKHCCDGLSDLGCEYDYTRLAFESCIQSKSQILELSGEAKNKEELTAKVSALTEEWLKSKAANILNPSDTEQNNA